MEQTIVGKAVDYTRQFWPFRHPDDLVKVVGIFETLIKEGCRAKDGEIYQYAIRDEPEDDPDEMRQLASELQQIYEVVAIVLDPSASRLNEESVRRHLFG